MTTTRITETKNVETKPPAGSRVVVGASDAETASRVAVAASDAAAASNFAAARSAAAADEARVAREAYEAPPEQIIILERRKKSKKGRKKTKYTRGTKGGQKFLLGLSEAGYRVANSFSEGLNTFVKRSKNSQRKKRDGLIRYSLRNASRGISDGLTELGKAPEEITDRIGTGTVWRVVRVVTPFR